MKKILLSLYIIFSIGLLSAYGQCLPDTSIHTSGIFPDSATGLTPGMVNTPYNQVMQVRVPADTVTIFAGNPVTLPITDITLTSFTGLPPGLSYSCTPSNCVFPGGTNGCVLISGTPTAAGTYNPIAITTTHAVYLIFPVTQIDTINYYHIVIAPSNVGIPVNGSHNFAVDQNTPNPFNDFCNIHYVSPMHGNVLLKVINILGKEIVNKTIDANVGDNSYKLDAREFASGVYFYSLTCGSSTITKRMVISRR